MIQTMTNKRILIVTVITMIVAIVIIQSSAKCSVAKLQNGDCSEVADCSMAGMFMNGTVDMIVGGKKVRKQYKSCVSIHVLMYMNIVINICLYRFSEVQTLRRNVLASARLMVVVIMTSKIRRRSSVDKE